MQLKVANKAKNVLSQWIYFHTVTIFLAVTLITVTTNRSIILSSIIFLITATRRGMWRRMRAYPCDKAALPGEKIKGTNCVSKPEGPAFCRSQHWAVQTVTLHVYYLDVNMAVRPRSSTMVWSYVSVKKVHEVCGGNAFGVHMAVLNNSFRDFPHTLWGKADTIIQNGQQVHLSFQIPACSLFIPTCEAKWTHLLTWLLNTR